MSSFIQSVISAAFNRTLNLMTQSLIKLDMMLLQIPIYRQLISGVNNGFPSSKSCLPNDLLTYWKFQDDLTHVRGLELYRHRIFVSATIREEILPRVHSSHRGIEATKQRATQTVWWPDITSDINTTSEVCSACKTLQRSLQKEPHV